MNYTSLSHNDRGHNTQLDFTSIQSWQEYTNRNSDIIWSRLFETKSGKLVRSYFVEYEKVVPGYPTNANPNWSGRGSGG